MINGREERSNHALSFHFLQSMRKGDEKYVNQDIYYIQAM
jgi:hypothetical protein